MIMWVKWLFIWLYFINAVILIWLSVRQYKKGDRMKEVKQCIFLAILCIVMAIYIYYLPNEIL